MNSSGEVQSCENFAQVKGYLNGKATLKLALSLKHPSKRFTADLPTDCIQSPVDEADVFRIDKEGMHLIASGS
jgi:hypothetical protein